MKRRIISLLFIIFFVLVLTACDITVDVKSDNSAVVTIKCDEDDIKDTEGLDPRDLRDFDDLEDLVDDFSDSRLDEVEIAAQSFVQNGDEYTFKISVSPADDLQDAYYDGIVIGNAEEILDIFADDEYSDDFSDIYDEEFSKDIDDEYFYAWDGNGDELDDRDIEDYFDAADLKNLNCIFVNDSDNVLGMSRNDPILSVPGNVQFAFADYDGLDIQNNSIELDSPGDFYIIYSKGLSVLLIIIIIAAILLLAGGAVLFFVLRKKKRAGNIAPQNTLPGSRFCTNCGMQMFGEDTFCPNCGTKN